MPRWVLKLPGLTGMLQGDKEIKVGAASHLRRKAGPEGDPEWAEVRETWG